DVKCSHGATVGPVDKEQLFYMMSRGLSLKEAEELIVTGFFAQVLNTIGIKGVAEWINDLAAEKIHQ
ncbi:MAG: SufD family Fe-S cluster assembly protein, partial [Cyanobacteria bacterium SZAS LIN-2]|nr:SufD family Fe-S cluster assembly protein [Cyanobacteria bacterium SZAS LIN-2]